MNEKIQIFLFLILVLIFYIDLKFFSLNEVIPNYYYKDHYWGKEKIADNLILPKDDLKIYPFKINYDREMINDLNERLSRAKFIHPLEDSNFEYGFNGNELKKIISYWHKKYNWNTTLDKLNSFPHFKTQIEGLNIHFIHVKSSKKAKKNFPLLLCHGWPGSFYEFYKMIPLLIKPENDLEFDLIIPSIPGFSYSDAPYKPGLDAMHTARIFVKLMKRLGHEKFFYHGGDWGSIIGQSLIAAYHKNLYGTHLTMLSIDFKPIVVIKILAGYLMPSLIYENQDEIKDFHNLKENLIKLINEIGYFFLQSTKPDTIGSLLVDSPVGLAAYILEKFSTWTSLENLHKKNGGLEEKFNLDELLTNVMIYWTSGNAGYAHRYYKEFCKTHFGVFNLDRVPIDEETKIGFSFGENEFFIGKAPRSLLKYKKLVHYRRFKNLGHFTALEEPVLMNIEIRTFVTKVLTTLN